MSASPGAGPARSRRSSTASATSAASSAASSSAAGLDLFADPPGYYPPSPPPTTERHALGRSGLALTLHLVGHSALEAHRLWNGSRVLADYLEEAEAAASDDGIPGPVAGKTVLELGAGAALPGIVCAFVLGARRVVVTDFPDPDLVATMRQNADEAAAATGQDPGRVVADGYVWGADAAPLLARVDGGGGGGGGGGFDVVLLADLLFRHAEHAKLARSVAATLARAPASRAYVFFTSYRPWLRAKDLAFFARARDAGLVVEPVLERRLARPPLFFRDDPGDPAVRSTVSGYALRWPVGGEDPRAFWPPPGGIPGEGGDGDGEAAQPGDQGQDQQHTQEASPARPHKDTR